ncbi:MAG: hypothetical protein L0Y71_18800 [Gemmataceae bacterium]|nr:hypothetical protein [Gemmataceae bacterium]
MTFPKARIAVAALLLVGWLGYLAYLVAMTRDAVILSRPQILVSNLCILATISDRDGGPDPRVQVAKVLWPATDDQQLEGRELVLEDLADVGAAQGWSGANEYLLPLTVRQQANDTTYEVTMLPPIQFHPFVPKERRIYRATADALRQFWELKPNN